MMCDAIFSCVAFLQRLVVLEVDAAGIVIDAWTANAYMPAGKKNWKFLKLRGSKGISIKALIDNASEDQEPILAKLRTDSKLQRDVHSRLDAIMGRMATKEAVLARIAAGTKRAAPANVAVAGATATAGCKTHKVGWPIH